MNPVRLRFEVMRDLYQSQRQRREQIRDSVATPVAGLAFSVYSVSALAAHFDAGHLAHPVNLTIAVLALISILFLMAGAFLIIRLEKNVVYMDPPDLEELVSAERRIRNSGHDDDEAAAAQLHDLMAGAYDIVYRRYFAANEQAARDRTRGLHFILYGLCLIAVALAFLPFQQGGG